MGRRHKRKQIMYHQVWTTKRGSHYSGRNFYCQSKGVYLTTQDLLCSSIVAVRPKWCKKRQSLWSLGVSKCPLVSFNGNCCNVQICSLVSINQLRWACKSQMRSQKQYLTGTWKPWKQYLISSVTQYNSRHKITVQTCYKQYTGRQIPLDCYAILMYNTYACTVILLLKLHKMLVQHMNPSIMPVHIYHRRGLWHRGDCANVLFEIILNILFSELYSHDLHIACKLKLALHKEIQKKYMYYTYYSFCL